MPHARVPMQTARTRAHHAEEVAADGHQIDLICAPRLISAWKRLAAPNGGEVRVHVLGRWPRSVMTRDLTGPGHRVFGMARKGLRDQDGAEAVRRLLSGLARGDNVFHLAAAIEELHPRHNTFPGEVFMRLSADALEVAGVGQDDPIPYTELREKYLGECKFQGRQNRKIQFAILASVSARGGIQPDLLDEVAWWQADEFWWYALAAAVAVIRACADRMRLSAPAFVQQLSAR
jgi:hypothetical protein